MKYCTNCGKPIKENADVCLSCGKLLKQVINKSEKRNSFYWIFSLIFGNASIISFVFSFLNSEIFFLSFVFSILAIVFGGMGFLQKNKLNIIGFVMGILSMIALILVFLIGIYLIFFETELYRTREFDNENNESDDLCSWHDEFFSYEEVCNIF